MSVIYRGLVSSAEKFVPKACVHYGSILQVRKDHCSWFAVCSYLDGVAAYQQTHSDIFPYRSQDHPLLGSAWQMGKWYALRRDTPQSAEMQGAR